MPDEQSSGKTRIFFGAYSQPTYTIVPDQLFDQQLSHLSGSELKVLLYIIRRTFGFKKDSDAIALSQICSGITTRDGKVLDSGTGLAKRHVISALKSLEEMGIISAERRSSRERGFEPTVYRLNTSQDTVYPLVTKGNKGSDKREQGLVPKGNIQETVLQQTEEQETDLTNLRMASPSQEKQIKSPSESPGNNHTATNGAKSVPDGEPEENDEDREIIREYVQDFGRELGDQSKLRSSVSRACNLYRKSGVSRDIFIARMYEAKSITQERTADIRNQQQDNGRALPTKSKMAYWFATLSNLLEGKVPPRRRSRQETLEPITP